MKVSNELEEKMSKCLYAFKIAYDLEREISTEICEASGIEDDMFNIEDYIGICLIDHEDVDELIEMCKNEFK